MNLIGFGAMEDTKPYECIGIDAMEVIAAEKFLEYGAKECADPSGLMEIAADEVLGCEDEQCENPGAADIGFCESASQPLVLCAECGVSMSVACLACNFANFEAPVEMLREFAYACLGLRGKLRRSQLSWVAARHQSLSSALLQVPIRQHDLAALQASLAEIELCLMD